MTPNKEDYLKCIYEIGTQHEKISNKEIAARMQVSPPAVTEMVKRMISENLLIKDKTHGYLLTELGLQTVSDLFRKHRLIDVEWENNNTTKDYIAHIDIYGLNRAGLLNDVLQVLSNTAKMISTVNAQPTKDMKFANIHISFGIPNLSMLTTVVDKIKSVPEVYSVKRTNG